MAVYTTEITSSEIASDNPLHQRLLKAYEVAVGYVKGDLLEIGCGEGRGIELLAPLVNSYSAIDKIDEVIRKLSKIYPQHTFIKDNIPPINSAGDAMADCIVSFQVIEHIKKDREFLEEIYRILKPGGVALITTPNLKKSLTRNPWHIREYTAKQLKSLGSEIFDRVEIKGITGNDKVWKYYEMNKQSVEKITRFDFLKLQYRLPAFLLKIPYEILNRINRNKLKSSDSDLVRSISLDDYLLTDDADNALDLFLIGHKV